MAVHLPVGENDRTQSAFVWASQAAEQSADRSRGTGHGHGACRVHFELRPHLISWPKAGPGPDAVVTKLRRGLVSTVQLGALVIWPEVSGKFLAAGREKLYLRGVTYGPFRPREDGSPYPVPGIVEQDFAAMGAYGFNAVRTYTVPPSWLLDCAAANGLRVMVGLPWEQHIAFLHERWRVDSIERRIRDGVGACAGHPAGPVLRRRQRDPRVNRALARPSAHRALPGEALPSRQRGGPGRSRHVGELPLHRVPRPGVSRPRHLQRLPEAQRPLAAYLARLQNLAGERPLLMTEVGLDSQRHGEEDQARVLRWQIATAAAEGCAGLGSSPGARGAE
jgi:hypothetical protein